MVRALRLLLALTGRRAGAYGAHARAKATHLALLAGFGAAAAAFLIALVTVALARWLGLIPALAILAGVCIAGCLAVLIALQAERRAHREALAQQSLDERRIAQAALLTALPGLRRGGIAAAGLAVAFLVLASRRHRPRD